MRTAKAAWHHPGAAIANSEIIEYFDPTTNPPTPKGTLYRICNRSNVLISLGTGGDD
jgi:hypothetical protein